MSKRRKYSKKRINGGACTPENESCIMQLTPEAGPQRPRRRRRRTRRRGRSGRLAPKARGARVTYTPKRSLMNRSRR